MIIREKKLIIELDGPHHYLFNHPEKNLGINKFNMKLLEGLGYTVINVNADAFTLMNAEEKKAYLQSLIK